MKTKILVLMAGFLFLAFSSVEAKSPKEVSVNEFSKYIENSISYPDFAVEDKLQGTVNVVLELNDANELQIAQIWGSDSRLVKYVERRIKRAAKKQGPINDLSEEAKLVRIKFNLVS